MAPFLFQFMYFRFSICFQRNRCMGGLATAISLHSDPGFVSLLWIDPDCAFLGQSGPSQPQAPSILKYI